MNMVPSFFEASLVKSAMLVTFEQSNVGSFSGRVAWVHWQGAMAAVLGQGSGLGAGVVVVGASVAGEVGAAVVFGFLVGLAGASVTTATCTDYNP